MKFSNLGRGTLASVLGLATCLGITACTRDYTVAFVYSIDGKDSGNGHVNVYAVDYQSGALTSVSGSRVSTCGINPLDIVASSDQQNLYVISNSCVSRFKIGTDGKVYGDTGLNTAGSVPVALAIAGDIAYTSSNASSSSTSSTSSLPKFLYVLDTYRTGATSGPGQIDIYSLNSDMSINALVGSTNVGLNPVDLVASADAKFVYVIHRDTSTTNNLIGFSRDTTTGLLTALPSTAVTTTGATGYSSGVAPSSIVEDPKARYIYVTDRLSNQVIGYTLNTNGEPVVMTNGPFGTGSYPVGSTIDPRGKFLYVTNYNGNSISVYTIDTATGNLSASSGSTTVQTGTGPTCVTVENALGIYLYTSNYLDNTITGLQLNASTGATKNIQNTPFTTGNGPTCAVAVANGQHSTQIVN